MTQIVPTVVAPVATKTRAAKVSKVEKPRRRSALTLVLGIVAVLWLLPVFGLLVTSFRTTTDAQSTGWWTVFTHFFTNAWTLDNYSNAFHRSGHRRGGELGKRVSEQRRRCRASDRPAPHVRCLRGVRVHVS